MTREEEIRIINSLKHFSLKTKTVFDAIKAIEESRAEINTLKAEVAKLQQRIVFWREDMDYHPERERTEAVKEFVDKLIAKAETELYDDVECGVTFEYHTLDVDDVYDTLKEMGIDNG